MFCLLAVFLYIIDAQESAWITSCCHKGLHCTAETEMDFFSFSNNVTLIESQDQGSGFIRESRYRVVF